MLGAALSLAAHLSALVAVLWSWPQAPPPAETPVVTVELVGAPPRSPGMAPAAAARTESIPRPARAEPAPTRSTRAPRSAPTREEAEVAPAAAALTETQVAGAAIAGSGEAADAGSDPGTGGGRACDMAGRVQNALRRDPLVRAAVAGSAGRAMMVWNGDWVRSRGEDGKGLAAVREAIMWEVAFAPPACRAQPVRGLVLLSLKGVAGQARLALGADAWRWSDLLTPRPGVPDEASNR